MTTAARHIARPDRPGVRARRTLASLAGTIAIGLLISGWGSGVGWAARKRVRSVAPAQEEERDEPA
jgi:hypothetical protein